MWGLVERDFHLTSAEKERLLAALADHLTSAGKSLHVSELRSALIAQAVLPPQLTDYMILGLAQTDELFRVFRGQLVGLREWNEPRRLTMREAFLQLPPGGSWTIPELTNLLSNALEREVCAAEISGAVKYCGFIFREDSRRWSRDEEADDDETKAPGYDIMTISESQPRV